MTNPNEATPKATFSEAFLLSIIAWNNAEAAVRDVLLAISKGGLGATIAIHQLGNTSLGDAIKTVASFHGSIDNPLAKRDANHLLHLVDGLDILRAYRNFYVHQIRGVAEGADKCEGLLWGLEVKAGYKWVEGRITLDEVQTFTKSCSALADYARVLETAMPTKGDEATPPEVVAQISLLLTSLQKPTWPEKLKKLRKNLLVPEPPPQS